MDTELDNESIVEEPPGEESNASPSQTKSNHTTWDPRAYAEQYEASLKSASKAKQNQKRAMKPMMHAKSNFTMSVTLVHQHRGLGYVPVRGKMDTGCDVNLISTEIIQRGKIKDDQVEGLDEEIELNGLEGTKYTLKKKIQLTWYLNRGMKSRVADFYIVEDGSFDVILGALFWRIRKQIRLVPAKAVETSRYALPTYFLE